MISFSIFIHAFHTFRPRFLGFEIFLGFLKIDELFVKFLGWVLLKWCYLLMHCISFAFLTMFHAFRCVYLLEPCVLVGLDWAKPMMIFLLHVIWSCIIHACIPFISFLLVLYVDWCFSVCLSVYLSVSLSLSLLDSPCMAPKHKNTPSQNPLRSGASSSDSTPFSVRFCDDKVC